MSKSKKPISSDQTTSPRQKYDAMRGTPIPMDMIKIKPKNKKPE